MQFSWYSQSLVRPLSIVNISEKINKMKTKIKYFPLVKLNGFPCNQFGEEPNRLCDGKSLATRMF
jgi:hypothetical protein